MIYTKVHEYFKCYFGCMILLVFCL